MKLTVMIQRRWWSAVTKYPRSSERLKTPGWCEFTSLPSWKIRKYEKWRNPGVKILCRLPRRAPMPRRAQTKYWWVLKKYVVQIVHSHTYARVKNIFQLPPSVAAPLMRSRVIPSSSDVRWTSKVGRASALVKMSAICFCVLTAIKVNTLAL